MAFSWIGKPGRSKWIFTAVRLATALPQKRVVAERLFKPTYREWAPGHIDSIADSGGRNAHFTAPKPPLDMPTMERRLRDRQPRKLGLNIGDQIAHDRILVALLRSIDGVCVVGRVPFRHDVNQPALCELSHLAVRPVTKTASSTVQQVHHWQFLTCNDAHRKHNAVRHIAIQRRPVEGNVAHCHLRL